MNPPADPRPSITPAHAAPPSPFGPTGQMPLPELPPPAMPRPSAKDDYVQKRALELALPEFRNWLTADGSVLDEAADSEALGYALFASHSYDGYAMARALERKYHWEPDAELVDLLEGAWVHCHRAIDELTAQWVEVCRIRPVFQVGDEVQMLRGYHPGGLSRGIIVRIDEELAFYHIHCADQAATSNWVVAYEYVSEVP